MVGFQYMMGKTTILKSKNKKRRREGENNRAIKDKFWLCKALLCSLGCQLVRHSEIHLTLKQYRQYNIRLHQ